MGAPIPLPLMQLMLKLNAGLSYSRNGNILRLSGPVQLSEALGEEPTIQEFVEQYGRLLYVGGAERIPVMTFPEEEEKGMPNILVSARWFLKNAGMHLMIRLATARIDADGPDDGTFQTRFHMQKPMRRTELFSRCDVVYCKFRDSDSEPSGMLATGRTAYELFYSNDMPIARESTDQAVDAFAGVMSKQALGRISAATRRAIGVALDNGLGNERDLLWVVVPRTCVWGMVDFNPDDFDFVDVPPPRVHPEIGALDLLRLDDPSIPEDASRFTVRCDDLNSKALVYLCRKTVSATGVEHSACENARLCYKKTGLMVFARDLGGYPKEPAPDADTVKAYRAKKVYFCANWKGLEGILKGEIVDGFEATLPEQFGHRKENMGRCVYEYLMEHCMNYPYGDLDCDLEDNPDMLQTADERTRIAVEFHMYMLDTLFGAKVDFSDYFISSADISKVTTHPDGTRTVEGKISRHFICNTIAFRTMLDQRMFINWCYTTLFAIFRKVEVEPTGCTDQELRFARLRITDARGAMRSFIDLGVYKAGCQLFRLFANSKAPAKPFLPQRRLVVAAINEYPIPEGSTEMDIVRLSLVQRVPYDFPDNKILEFRIQNSEQIPLMTYEMDDAGRLVDFHIWNPGEDPSKGHRKKTKKRRNVLAGRQITDLSKRYRVSGSSGSGDVRGASARSATSPVERKVLEFVAAQRWAKLWNDPSTKYGQRLGAGAKVAVQKSGDTITMIRITPKTGHECPCLLKWTLDEYDRKVAFDLKKQARKEEEEYQPAKKPKEAKDCPGHGNCPISIIISQHSETGRWYANQSCSFNCKQRAEASGQKRSVYLGAIPADFINDLQGEG